MSKEELLEKLKGKLIVSWPSGAGGGAFFYKKSIYHASYGYCGRTGWSSGNKN